VTAPLEGEAGTYPWFGFLFLCICQPFIRSFYHPVPCLVQILTIWMDFLDQVYLFFFGSTKVMMGLHRGHQFHEALSRGF